MKSLKSFNQKKQICRAIGVRLSLLKYLTGIGSQFDTWNETTYRYSTYPLMYLQSDDKIKFHKFLYSIPEIFQEAICGK